MPSFYDFYVANSAVRAPCAAIAKFTNRDTDNSEISPHVYGGAFLPGACGARIPCFGTASPCGARSDQEHHRRFFGLCGRRQPAASSYPSLPAKTYRRKNWRTAVSHRAEILLPDTAGEIAQCTQQIGGKADRIVEHWHGGLQNRFLLKAAASRGALLKHPALTKTTVQQDDAGDFLRLPSIR